ncbi:MAG: hypothetical protein LUE88_01565 [Clostridiales bacterium]|nr:hypothetical protein [Clostridiales bacterium]
MKDVLKELNQKQIKFICSECNITEDILMNMDDKELYDYVYDIMCEIEIAELPCGEAPESKRCEMVSDIVTLFGNALAEEEGFYKWQDEQFKEVYDGKA